MEQMFTAVIETVVRVNATAPAMGLSTESSVSRTVPSHPLQGVSVGQAEPVPAQDAIQLRTFWPSEKVNVVAAVAKILEEDDVLQLLEIIPEDLCGCCSAYMLTAAQGDTAAARVSFV